MLPGTRIARGQASEQASGQNVAAELTDATEVPFENGRAMPPSVYTSPDFLALELASIFRGQWICVGRASAIPEAGDYLTYEVAGQPVIVLRGADGGVRAFSNVCLHRMSVLLHGRGRVQAIVCPYHAWTYGLDGALRGAPQMRASPGFRRQDYRLPEIRSETWLGWIYVTLDPSLPPVAEHLAPVAALVGRYGMEHYVETFREEHVW
ncbi:MAG: Rieske (2Fe-2S) protein, partial [Pseudomonadota bacterium]|nr:Rieske (2Fe-2S) protein [Pseudomonadota bacterium]